MNRFFKSFMSILLVAIMISSTLPMQTIADFDYASAFGTVAKAVENAFKPKFTLSKMEIESINYGDQHIENPSLSTQNLRLGIGDSEVLFVNIEDENGNPVENFDGLTWWASPASAVKLEVDADTRYCTVTILDTEESEVVVYASAYGQTLSMTIEIIGNGLKFASDEYYILVGSTELVLSFDMISLFSARATWKVSDKNYKISASDYSFVSSNDSLLSVTGKSHTAGSVGANGEKTFTLYPSVKANKEGTVTLTVNAGNDSDTCTIHIVPLKEYKIEAYSEELESPLADAEISTDVFVSGSLQTQSVTGKTGADGIVVLKLPDVSRCPAFDINGFADFHPEKSIKSTELDATKINRFPLKCDVYIPGTSTSSSKVDALSTNIGDNLVNLLSFDLKIELSDKLDLNFEVDTKNKKIKGTIEGSLSEQECKFDKDDTDITSKTRKESYQQYKNLFKGLKSNQQCYDDWRSLRKKSTKFKADIGISAELSLCGYIEMDYSSGKLQLSEGGIVLSGEASVDKNIYTSIPAVYIAFEIRGGVETGLKLFRVAAGGVGVSFHVEFTVGGGAGLGLGCSKVHLEIGVEGEFKFKIELSTEKKLSLKEMLTVTAKLSGYLEYKVDVWIIEWGKHHTLDIATAELFPKPSIEFAWQTKDLNNLSFELLSRDYLFENVIGTQSVTAEKHISNVYPNGNPQIEMLDNGNKVAVWLVDTGNKSSVNRTTLVYSLFNGSVWSEPQAVCESGRLDGTPVLCSDGNKAYVMWLRGEEVFADDISFDEYLTKTELVFSTFNGSVWSQPTRIGNDNGKYQLYYSMAVNNGNVTVSWTENSDNNAFLSSGTTTVYRQDLVSNAWGTPVKVVSTTKPVNSIASGFIGDKPQVAYSVDEDGQYITSGDNSVYVGNNRITPDDSVDYLGVKYFDGQFYFVGNDLLVLYDGSLIKTETPVGNNFQIESNADKYVLVNQIYDGFKNELYVSYSDNGVSFTDPIQLTSYDNQITDYDYVLNNDGSITVSSDLRYILNDNELGHTDFIIETFADKYEIELTDAAYNMSLTYEQQDIMFEATVRNQGTKPLNGFRLNLADSKGRTVYYKDYNYTLDAGETAVETITYVLPDSFMGESLTLSVVSGQDTDQSNNSHTFTFKYADISVSNCEITSDGYIVAVVQNTGYDLAEDVAVQLCKFNEQYDEFGTVAVGDIAVGESETIRYKLPVGIISFDSYLSNNSFKVEATTTTGEYNYSNNEAIAIVSPVRVSDIQLVNSSVVLAVGDAVTLAVKFTPANATDKTVYWFTSDEKVVEADENGVITAVGLGTATITAISSDGRIEDVCQVTVSQTVPVTGIEIVPSSTSILVNATKQLTANVLPSNATNKAVSWSTSNASVATVSNTGSVTAKAKGTVTITAKTADGGYQARCTVTVVSSSVAVTGITLDPSAMTLYVGDVGKLTETVSPSNATNTNVVWSSSNTSVAKVDQNGNVTAIKSGTAIIKVTTADGGFLAQSTVTVKEKTVVVQGVEISKSTMQMYVGDTDKLTVNVLPSDATNKKVMWKSSDISVATVDANGNVVAVGEGNATISVETSDGGFIAQCAITVSAPVGHGKIVSVELYSAPNVTSYKYKQSGLNLNGLTLLVTYSDGATEFITDTSKMEISNFNNSSTGKRNVDVTYEGYTVSFQVEVKYTWWQWIIVIILFGWIWY